MLASAVVLSPSYRAPRAIPSRVALANYQAEETTYRALKAALPNREATASVVLISGCQDNQIAWDGPRNGAFTGTVLRIWNGGHYYGTLPQFRDEVAKGLGPTQIPNYYRVGRMDLAWELRRPFTI